MNSPVPAPKMLLYKYRGSAQPGELCKYDYNRQAKGESEYHGSHLNPNPRTNKQT